MHILQRFLLKLNKIINMHYQITIAMFDKRKTILCLSYIYNVEENVHKIETGFIFGYIIIALKKKEKE